MGIKNNIVTGEAFQFAMLFESNYLIPSSGASYTTGILRQIHFVGGMVYLTASGCVVSITCSSSSSE